MVNHGHVVMHICPLLSALFAVCFFDKDIPSDFLNRFVPDIKTNVPIIVSTV